MRLVIGVPTFNRGKKLSRVLALLRAQIVEAHLESEVTLLVADNASTDTTPEVCAEAAAQDDGVTVRVIRRPKNLGFNGNVWALYHEFEGDYLWTFADDDLPLHGAVRAVASALRDHQPEMLLFSFIQPPGSTQRTFNMPAPVALVTERGDCARYVCQMPKITLYVYRRAALSRASVALMEAQVRESGYAYVSLALSILGDAATPTVALISEPLATCDDDYLTLRISPYDWARAHQMWQHPFVLQWAPELAASAMRMSYENLLNFLWAWRVGAVVVEPEYLAEWWKAVDDLHAEWRWLASAPDQLLRFAVLKSLPRHLPRLLSRSSATLRRTLVAIRAARSH